MTVVKGFLNVVNYVIALDPNYLGFFPDLII